LDWPGVRLDFGGVTGTSTVKIRMNGNMAVFGYRLVDEASSGNNKDDDDDDVDDQFVLVTRITPSDYPLSRSDGGTELDPAKTYKISIWKRDDPMNGGATILGLVVDENGKGLHKHKEDAKYQDVSKKPLIEFVGDSDTVGFGVRGSKSTVWHYLLCEIWMTLCRPSIRQRTDVTQSWAHRAARELKADYHVIALSGVGAKYNVADVEDNMIAMYPRMLGTKSNTSVEPKEARFLGPTPDAVVIYIGQNDERSLSSFSLEKKLEGAFTGLLEVIRSYRPAPIPIVVVIPAPDARLSCQGTEKTSHATAVRQAKIWNQVVEKMADDAIHVVENQHEPQIEHNSPEEYGTCLHWNVSGNRKWASGLTPKLREVLKW
jgi:lysophospholipase L1-like esterase